MSWGKEWPVEIIPPSKPENQQWSTGALIFKEMTKEEVLAQWPTAPIAGWPTGITSEMLGVNPSIATYGNMPVPVDLFKPKTLGWDLGNTSTDKTIITEGEIVNGELLITDIREATEQDIKIISDAILHGIGFTQDGKHVPLEKVYNNLSPTHDPYTNPNACIYYECKCGKILDPDTKSFAALNNYASSKGWKIRWKKDGMGYEPFCVECGKDVE